MDSIILNCVISYDGIVYFPKSEIEKMLLFDMSRSYDENVKEYIENLIDRLNEMKPIKLKVPYRKLIKL